jgi:energy-coupling factor transporter ATP-binding protein EcfA2
MKRIILISGKQGSGKTTQSNALSQIAIQNDFTPKVFKFAGPIYKIHNLILPVFKLFGWRPETMDKDGELLQELGMFCRKVFGENCFADVVRKDVEAWLACSPYHLAIVDDCRFENEFDAFEDAMRIRLDCKESMRKERCSYWRENTNHPSEIGLDNYVAKGKFSSLWASVYSTEAARSEVVAKSIWEHLEKGFKF